jgi:hypothetical protein
MLLVDKGRLHLSCAGTTIVMGKPRYWAFASLQGIVRCQARGIALFVREYMNSADAAVLAAAWQHQICGRVGCRSTVSNNNNNTDLITYSYPMVLLCNTTQRAPSDNQKNLSEASLTYSETGGSQP